ncbi:hypothetical protein JTB14_006239 [Gonioctena quinquepunctata]|nr:hypothetical protein JTB14_006239 [Gonioctena quinquepunctata]
MSVINQKEYLKKYLGLGKSNGTKKKKKKSDKTLEKRLKIIDDDIEHSLSQEIKEDLEAANEDAPQIVSIIDDRPPSLRVDEETKNKLWKPIGEDTSVVGRNTGFSTTLVFNKSKNNLNNKGDGRKSKLDNTERIGNAKLSSKNQNSPDSFPPKVKSEHSPKRSSLSPPRRKSDADNSPKRRDNSDSDQSPKRKKYSIEDQSPKRRRRNSDASDQSPRRRKNSDSTGQSPRRKINSDKGDLSPRRKNHRDESDLSPRRIKSRTEDLSPRRRNNSQERSPRRWRNNEGYHSPKRRNYEDEAKSSHRSDRHTDRSERDSGRSKPSRWGEDSPRSSDVPTEKAEKTLSGKKSGLQNAKHLVQELISLKEREDDIFLKMAADVSGENAATVSRKKKTTTPEEDAEQQRKQHELQEKYSRWGKGIKQVDDHNDKMAEQLHEMNKPLARYADDEDLEKYLKEQERDGDPMLMYIRKKKKKKAVEAGVPEKPVYMGDFMPNRFGIRPGYRWDGVDRSNGYEQKLFQAKNSEKARMEEAFLWSNEDM